LFLPVDPSLEERLSTALSRASEPPLSLDQVFKVERMKADPVSTDPNIVFQKQTENGYNQREWTRDSPLDTALGVLPCTLPNWTRRAHGSGGTFARLLARRTMDST